MSSILKALTYALSLPERAVRSLSAAVGGVSKLMTDTLLPRSLRGTRFYKSFLGNTQRFLIESLGDVKSGAGEKLPDDFVARKIVGDVVDGAGMFAFHFSPMWFFALVGDAAGGTKDYLARVAKELEKDGAIAPGHPIHDVGELFDALSKASAKTVTPFDAPPLSKKDLLDFKAEISASYAELYAKGKKAVPSVDALWASFEKVRRAEKVPLLKLSGAMAFAATKAAGKATGSMFSEKVVASYAASLADVRKEGFAGFFAREAAPYVAAVGEAFSLSKKTWTERLLTGEIFRKGKP